jgi:peroxiredoxin
MTFKKIFTFSLLSFLLINSTFSLTIGDKAPSFKLTGHDNKSYSLTDLKGKWVVLEWFNQDCPFVKKHYDSGNMQQIQQEFTKKGVQWFSISSSAEGKQGHLTSADEANKVFVTAKSQATSILLDKESALGKIYQAQTTPHMFIIDPKGKIAYEGAIDDHPSAQSSDIPQSKNYIVEALNAGMNGKKIAVQKTKPYGGSVKY